MGVSSEKPGQNINKEGVAKIIRDQYLLHEVVHHLPYGLADKASAVVLTKAHRMADVYKCLHQGIFGYGPAEGVKHIPSPEYFRKHLVDDYYRIEPQSDEPVFEAVAAGNAVLRVNLRPYRKLFDGRDSDGFELLENVVMDAAQIEKGSWEALIAAVHYFKELNQERAIRIDDKCYGIPPRMVSGFIQELDNYVRNQNVIPLLSHSKAYHRLNHPSYVVVDLAVLEHSQLAFLLKTLL